jgi:cytochrome c oxidase subunit 2
MNPHSILDPAGTQAQLIHGNWLLLWYVCLAVYVIIGGFYLWVLFRSRRARSVEEGPADITHPVQAHAGKYVVVATVITAVILVVFLIVSAVVGSAVASTRTGADMELQITGHQWWWEVHYVNGNDPSRSLTTANEIHIPVGKRVHMTLLSGDVIHSLWIPNLNGKRDLIPGRANFLTIEASQPGRYRGQCAEFCGMQHAHMALEVVAQSQAEFGDWFNRQLAPANEPVSPEQIRGHDVFVNGPCALCHTIRGTQAGASVAPDLTHVGSRRLIAAGTLPNTKGHLAGWISNSQSIKPGNRMPPLSLPSEDLQAVLAYLGSLQ